MPAQRAGQANALRNILILFLLLTALPARAQTEPPQAPLLSVDQAVRQAAAAHPRVLAGRSEIAAARANLSGARALGNPTVTFTPTFTRGGSDEEFLFQQPLELNGVRSARAGVAAAQLKQQEARSVASLGDLIYETRLAYYELARARELEALAAESLRIADEFAVATRRQAEEGLRPGVDAVSTGIEVSRARQQLLQAQARSRTAAGALNLLMGRGETEPVEPLTPLPTPEAPADPAVLAASAMANRLEIAEQDALREEFRQEARLAIAQGRPDLAPQLRADSLTRGSRQVGFGLGITLPLLDHGSRRGRIARARLLEKAQSARTEALRLEIRQQVLQALERVKAASAVIREYEVGLLAPSQRLLDAARTGYQSGLYSVVQLLEAQRTFRAVQADYRNALADHAVARAALDRAVGTIPAGLIPLILSNPERKE